MTATDQRCTLLQYLEFSLYLMHIIFLSSLKCRCDVSGFSSLTHADTVLPLSSSQNKHFCTVLYSFSISANAGLQGSETSSPFAFATQAFLPSSVGFSLRGRFSVINLCRDVETSQVFVAKITPYQAEQRQLVLREYQLLKRLHHPHLVQLHAAFITSCYMVLVEELCPGKELLHSLAAR